MEASLRLTVEASLLPSASRRRRQAGMKREQSESMEAVRWARERLRPRHSRAGSSSTRAPRPTLHSSASSLNCPPSTRFFDFSNSLCLQTLQQAKERVLPRKCGPFYENCYKFLVMYCNYVYSGKIKKIEPDVRSPRMLSRAPSRYVELRSLMRHVCTLPQTLRLAREMCEKAKTIGDPKNQNILNRLCELLERRLAKKEKKEKRNAGLVRVISIRARTHDACTRATHVPTRLMPSPITLLGPLSSLGCGFTFTGGEILMGGCRVHECGPFEAGQVHEERQGPDNRGTEGACPAPPICVGTHACRESHLNGEITSGESCIPSGFTAFEGLDLDLGPWHSTRHFDAALGAQQHVAPTWPEAGKALTPSMFSHCLRDRLLHDHVELVRDVGHALKMRRSAPSG